MILSPSTQADAVGAAGMEAAEAEAFLAAGTFGAALRASPEFSDLMAAERTLSADAEATAAIEAFGALQAELRVEIAVGAITDDKRIELDRLRERMTAIPSVASYVAATAAFESVCRETAAVISAQIGIDFAANCRSGGCCG
ncbi:MAG: YlbF family regulator [Candidatus Limnocylindrales bacterium]